MPPTLPSRVYKVVLAYYKDTVLLRSSLCVSNPGWTVYYARNKLNVPTMPGSYLYAFRTEKDATEYMEDSSKVLTDYAALHLWECQASVVSAVPCNARGNDYAAFWGNQLFAVDRMSVNAAPGTVWCTSLELTHPIIQTQVRRKEERRDNASRSFGPPQSRGYSQSYRRG